MASKKFATKNTHEGAFFYLDFEPAQSGLFLALSVVEGSLL